MQHFSVLTLFPEMFNDFLSTSIIKRAIMQKKVKVDIIDIRQFAINKHHQVDDYQYGGGEGMVMMIEPTIAAIRSCQQKNSIVIFLTPQGKKYHQTIANELSDNNHHLILLCGHYEGIDERILSYINLEISLGDYVLTGGELASMVLIDSITRLVPGVITSNSKENESFSNNLLDYPVYTKPVNFENHLVPEVLLSGHHQKIAEWRAYQALKKTYYQRPDLIKSNELSLIQKEWLKDIKNEEKKITIKKQKN